MIPYGRQQISDADIQAVVDVLRSDFLTQGPVVPAFERAVADYCGAAHAVAVNSATSALHLACLALGVGAGDVVWTSPITFVASANCARYCGAAVDFVDVDPCTGCLDPAALERKLATAEGEGRLPKAVIPVHLAGEPCDMVAINALSRRYGFAVIEDASHALGGRHLDARIGSGRYSDVTVFSFHPVKIITTGEGGMAVTGDEALARRMRLLRSHGVTRDDAEMTGPSHGPWYYQQIDLGFNYRLTDVQAALGLSQLTRLDRFIARRHELAAHYDECLRHLPLAPLQRRPEHYSALHLYVVRLQLDRLRRTRREVFEALRADGIGVNLHYIPVYRQPFYERNGYDPAAYPEAEQYYAEAMTLPLFPALSHRDQDAVIRAVKTACA